MLGLRLTVPIACFRKGLAREFLETEPLPPPSTCYGFLLSLVGETRRMRHVGCRVTPTLVGCPELSVVLRMVWRVKSKPLGASGNTRPDFQQLLSPVEVVVWLDSSEESNDGARLETRVTEALASPQSVSRFGGLSLGESTHLVDEVTEIGRYTASRCFRDRNPPPRGRAFLLAPRGRLTLPIWVDHVGSIGTRHVTGDLCELGFDQPPELSLMPRIEPPEQGPSP
jgi:CRISPR-associated protein Cas5t